MHGLCLEEVHRYKSVDYFTACSKKKCENVPIYTHTLYQSNQLQMTWCGTISDEVSRIKVVACHETEVTTQ